MKFTPLERAFTTLDLLIAGAAAVMVAAACVFALSTFTHAAYAQTYNSSAKAAAQTVVDSLERDCSSAIACFVPANDVGGHSNSDGHEVAMYTRDASGAGKFWSYCYRATSTTNCSTAARIGSVNLYGAYAWTDLTQNGGAGPVYAGAIASNVLGLTAKTIPASQLLNATSNPLTATVFQTAGYTTITDVTRQTGYTNVLAGNQVTIVSISTEGLTRTIHIAAGARPTHVQTVIGQVTPPPNALNPIGSGTTLTFQNPIAAAQSTGISENNYGTRSTTPPQIYTLTSSSCASVANVNPSGNLDPTSDGTGDGTFTVTPIVHVTPTRESCTMAYTDNVGQSATFSMTVGQTFAPIAQAGATSYMSGNAVSFTATEQNYATIANGGGFTAATSGVCNPPVLANETMNGTTYIATYTATTSSNGNCNFSAVDVYGQSAIAGTSVIKQQLVCNTDPSAGETIGTIQYVGTTASPPCAPPPPPSTPPACPIGFTGTPPNCDPITVNPTPAPPPCAPSLPDGDGFSSCMGTTYAVGTTLTITRCGTRTKITVPPSQFSYTYYVFQNGNFWGSYSITMSYFTTSWNQAGSPGVSCTLGFGYGVTFATVFSLVSVTPAGGNAVRNPGADTGDTSLGAGDEFFISAPSGGGWFTS